MTALDEKARLYRNVSAVKHHWLRVELQAKAGNRNALGARLSLELADGAKLFNHLTTSVGYASASEPAAHFGLGSHPGPATLTILWPDGSQQTREIEQTNQTLVIQQETDELERER